MGAKIHFILDMLLLKWRGTSKETYIKQVVRNTGLELMGERSVSPEQRCLLSLLGSPGLGNIFGMFQKRRLRRLGLQ